jgi:hypothetical protein
LIFKQINKTFNIIALNYWSEYVQCYELQEMMRQDDINFTNILNKFKIVRNNWRHKIYEQ